VALKRSISAFLWIACFASSTLTYANSDSTTIGISVVVPERTEDQKCTIGFENSHDNQLITLQHSGCSYQISFYNALINKPLNKTH